MVLAAWGYAGDVTPSGPVPWREKIRRLVFLAAVNRGWTISSALNTWDSAMWRTASLFNEFIFDGRSTIFQTRRGTPFLVATRLQWMRLMRKVPQAQIPVVQLLGTIDDIVSPEDAVDFAADVESGEPNDRKLFFMLELPQTGHTDAVDVADPLNPAARARAEIIRRALNADEAALACDPAAVNRDYLDDTPRPPPDPNIKNVVFVIHGIRDKGFWTNKIARKIREFRADGSVLCITRTYGYFPMAPFVFRMFRREKVEWLMDLYAEARAQFPDAKFSYVGHSNGTYLAAAALRDYPDTAFESIVFAGSVVRRDYDWRALARPLEKDKPPRVRRMWNFVATADWVVAIFPKGLEPIRLFDLGGAGHDGFASKPDDIPFYEVRFVRGMHSAGIRESQWDEITDFVLDGEPPQGTNPDYANTQCQLVYTLGRISSELLVVAVTIFVFIFSHLASSALQAPTASASIVFTLSAMSFAFILGLIALKF
ncbi:hypothetical protein V5F29_05345 [Xanthobacter aminoxidans]|uniref:hypothetical protein n=1 Tax=Xanthobacter aminoxidans TaxID=186280 RepID=UPI003729E3BC